MNFSKRQVTLGILVISLIFGLYKMLDFKINKEPDCVFNNRKDASELIYTDHARCRMECRFVKRETVERIYREGTVNCHKSGRKEGDMRYALESHVKGGDLVRVIVEDEDDKHIVITVIRVDVKDQCSC